MGEEPIFSQEVSGRDLLRTDINPVVRNEYRVIPNVVGLAEALVVGKGQSVRIQLPGERRQRVFPVRKFVPREGFDVNDQGELIVRAGATANDLSFLVYAAGHGHELSLNVEKGRMFGGLNGTFARSEQAWELRSGAGGAVLRDIDASRIPRHAADRRGKGLGAHLSLGSTKPSRTDASVTVPIAKHLTTVDVLVVHTANAMTLVGQTGMSELMQGGIDDMQIALENSQLGHVRLRNVMPNGQISVPVGYTEPFTSSNPQVRFINHRSWARTSNEVASLRNSYQADLVVMAVADGGFCGIAYTQRPHCAELDVSPAACDVGEAYQAFSFAVVSVNEQCPRVALEFAHEVGHLFGLEHDPANGTPSLLSSFPWSFAHQVSTPSEQARTIMAYQLPDVCPWGCPVTLHYSNPNVNFQSLLPLQVPTGDDTEDLSNLTRRFNARTIALYAPVMAAFRGPPPQPSVAGRVFFGSFEPFPDHECVVNPHPNCPP
jgi:hypothetical protein